MLNQLIPPEIKDDLFAAALKLLAGAPRVRTILEIGSSSGQGSTEALAEAIRARPDRETVRLFCLEISQERFAQLARHYAADPFVHPYRLSSVAPGEFPSPEEVSFFYNSTPTRLNNYPLPEVLAWLRQDLDYLRASGLDANGIARIRAEQGIADFDLVLIDGSEFTGEREFHAIAGAGIIALDDVNSHKCYNAYQMLKHHRSYQLVLENLELRNGFAIFERRF